MPLDSRHYYRLRNLFLNRDEGFDETPLEAHTNELKSWAFTTKSRLKSHCWYLPFFLANPRVLHGAWTLSKNNPWEALGGKRVVWKFLRKLSISILGKRFKRGRYRKVRIPKIGKEGFRNIEVPQFKTRVVARAVYSLLCPIFDRFFYPLSVGSRPKKSRWEALAACEIFAKRGLVHWVNVDIKDAFGQLPKERCLQIMRKRLFDSPIMWVLEEISVPERKNGFPQGISTSGLALNVYLDHHFDHWFRRNFPEARMVRYVDDIGIFCRTKGQARKCYEAVRQRIVSIGLQIKESWEDAYRHMKMNETKDWLGIQIKKNRGGLRFEIPETAWDGLKEALSLSPMELSEFDEIDEDFNSTAGGWFREYAVGILKAKELILAKKRVSEISKSLRIDMDDFVLRMSDVWENASFDFKIIKGKVLKVVEKMDSVKEIRPRAQIATPPSSQVSHNLGHEKMSTGQKFKSIEKQNSQGPRPNAKSPDRDHLAFDFVKEALRNSPESVEIARMVQDEFEALLKRRRDLIAELPDSKNGPTLFKRIFRGMHQPKSQVPRS